MSINLDDYSLAEIVDNLWCVVDTVTGMTHIGVLVNENDNTRIVLYSPRCVIESEDGGQVILTQPMYIGNSNGVFKLNCNTNNVQFTPCTEVIEAYIKSFLREKDELDINTHFVNTIQ